MPYANSHFRLKQLGKIFLALGLALIAHTAALAGSTPSPEEIVKNVDQLRNPAESFRMRVKVLDGATDSGDRKVFEVSLSGNNRTLIETLEPARDKGRNLLMLNEEMWAYIPSLKRAVRVSLSQKLSGQAANGDISRMRWSGDYTPSFEKTEKTAKDQWVLLLEANKKGLTYDKIRVWVEQKTFRPLRAEFLTPAGKLLKKAAYSDYREMAGKIRPTRIEIQDALREQDRSAVVIESMEAKTFPASMFNQNNLQ